MSTNPVCVSCQRFYRPVRIGILLLENMPNGTWTGDGPTPPGPSASQWWKPYKLWERDLWRCTDCSHEILVSPDFRPLGFRPLAEHHLADFPDALKVNDY